MLLRMKGIRFTFTDERPAPPPDLPLTTLHKLEEFTAWMRSSRYSEVTIGAYTDAIGVFLRFFISKPAEEITADDLVTFTNGYILARKLSASYQNLVMTAVKLFFRTVGARVLT
jgi:integrase/recombinase XerD